MERKYNGYKNRETWNVVLWLMNDEGLYEIARKAPNYTKLIPRLKAWYGEATGDGIRWDDRRVSRREVSEVLRECR